MNRRVYRPGHDPRRIPFVIMMLVVSLSSCGGDNPLTPPPRQVLTLSVTPEETAVVIGGTVTMVATVTDQANNVVSGQTVTWSTSDSAIATVGSATGTVTGVAEGNVTVTATSGTLTTTSTVAVLVSAEFAADVLPIFTTNCAVSGCHVAPTPPQDLELSAGVAYTNIVDVPSQQSTLDRIEPGDPLASYLVHKIRGTQTEVGGTGLQMPRNQPPLASALINTIVAWVRDGAPDN